MQDNYANSTSKEVTKFILRITCLIIYMSRSSVCIVHALCWLLYILNVNNVEIEVGPDSIEVPGC